jgi:hypothetical protein
MSYSPLLTAPVQLIINHHVTSTTACNSRAEATCVNPSGSHKRGLPYELRRLLQLIAGFLVANLLPQLNSDVDHLLRGSIRLLLPFSKLRKRKTKTSGAGPLRRQSSYQEQFSEAAGCVSYVVQYARALTGHVSVSTCVMLAQRKYGYCSWLANPCHSWM